MNARPLTDVPDLPGPPRPPARGGCPRPARACLRCGGDHQPAAGAAFVPRGPQRSRPDHPPSKPAHRGSAACRTGARKCRGGRGVAPHPAGPCRELSLEPPADLPAFVLSSYERLPQLPPVALTWHDSDSTKGRIYVDRSGAVRFDQFASADATEPSSYRILSPNHRISGMASVESEAVWVEQGHEAIGEDPRVFLRTVLSAEEGPGCEMERDPGEVGNGTAAAGWRYVGLEYVAGRPTHHVAVASATSGSTSRPGSSCAPRGLRSMTLVSPSRSSPPRSPRSRSASSRQRCSNRRTASPACRRTSTAHTSARGISRTSSCPASRTVRRLRKRRLRRRPSPRPLRCPPCVQTRATARFRRETRASRSVHWPGPRRV